MFLSYKKFYFAVLYIEISMAVTRLKRKERVNKVVAKQRTASLKLHNKRVMVKSPYKDESGIILDSIPELDN